jgi:hypothetical protein
MSFASQCDRGSPFSIAFKRFLYYNMMSLQLDRMCEFYILTTRVVTCAPPLIGLGFKFWNKMLVLLPYLIHKICILCPVEQNIFILQTGFDLVVIVYNCSIKGGLVSNDIYLLIFCWWISSSAFSHRSWLKVPVRWFIVFIFCLIWPYHKQVSSYEQSFTVEFHIFSINQSKLKNFPQSHNSVFAVMHSPGVLWVCATRTPVYPLRKTDLVTFVS